MHTEVRLSTGLWNQLSRAVLNWYRPFVHTIFKPKKTTLYCIKTQSLIKMQKPNPTGSVRCNLKIIFVGP